MAWAVPLAAYIGAISYDLQTFCTNDPPAIPTITAADVAQLLAPLGDPVAHALAVGKFQDLVGAYAWHQFCKCDSVATPAPPAAPSPPANSPQLNPPSLPQPTAFPCGQNEGTISVAAEAHTAWHSIIGSGAQGSAVGSIPLPSGASRIEIDWDCSGSGSHSIDIAYQGFNAAGSFVDSASNFALDFNTSSHTSHALIGSPTTYKIQSVGNEESFPAYTVHARAVIYCGSATPTAPAGAPCVADPLTTNLLEIILANVTLLQRQLTPYAFIPGTSHSIADSGEITLDHSLVGVELRLDTIPDQIGRADSDPVEYFGIGWLNIGAGDAWLGEKRVDKDRIVWTPRAMSSATAIAWTLHPGVEATLIELEREP